MIFFVGCMMMLLKQSLVCEFTAKMNLTDNNEFDFDEGGRSAAYLLKYARRRSYWAVTPEMQLDAINTMRNALEYAENVSWYTVKSKLGWE